MNRIKQFLKQHFSRDEMLLGILLLITPLTAFYLMQFVYSGGMPWDYSINVLVANYLCIGVLHFTLCALTNYIVLSCLITHLLCCIWGIANHYVSLFRGTPILPWDFTALGTAAAVADSYHFSPSIPMVIAALLLIAATFLLRKKLLTGRFRPSRNRMRLRITYLCTILICAYPVLRPNALGYLGIETDVWDQSASYSQNGALATFLRNTQFMSVEEPQDSSEENIERIASQVSDHTTAISEDTRPNIVAIMNESWADFEDFGNLSLSESVTDYVNSLDNCIFGHTYTSVFGAGTSASEFEFLTGNSMAFLPSGSIPYQQYILEPSASLASLLKENGYRTLAIHPGERTSWQRNQAYPLLGFDQFKCVDDMDVPLTEEHGYVSDQSSFEQIIYEFEHKAADERLFLFNVTIQNHGSYTVEDYPAEVTLTDEPGKYPMAEQYLTLANKTDEAFKTLIDYFSQQEEPTIILMFGDHQPSVEQEFLDKAYGVTQDQMTMEQYMNKYKTPFLIWANYDLPDDEIPVTSLNFLGQYLLSYSGIDNSLYEDFLADFQQTLPAITFVGYIGQNGKAYSHLETNDYAGMIEDYRTLAYDNLFGGKSRHTSFYQTP